MCMTFFRRREKVSNLPKIYISLEDRGERGAGCERGVRGLLEGFERGVRGV